MKSLSDLNTYGNTVITYTDLRTAKVVFDVLTPANQTTSFTTGGSSPLGIGINILDIILPDVEQVYFQVDVSATVGATVTFPALPAGYTVTNIGVGVYRVSNIKSAADWNIIKGATINSPSGYASNFTYTAFIGYESTKTKSWTITAKLTQQAHLFATSTFRATGRYSNVQGGANLTAVSTANIVGYKVKITSVQPIRATSSFATTITKVKPFSAALVSRSTFAGRYLNTVQSRGNFTSRSTFNSTSNIIQLFTGFFSNNFYNNDSTQLLPFGSIVQTPEATSYTTTITLNNSVGDTLGTISAITGSSVTFTGTKTATNVWLQGIYYYPASGTSQSNTFNYSITSSGGPTFIGTLNLYNSGALVNKTYTITPNSIQLPSATYGTVNSSNPGYWTPTYGDLIYRTKMNYLLIGGGGGGGGAVGAAYGYLGTGGAGGGGAMTYLSNANESFTAQNYYLTVGSGGAGGSPAQSGGDTTFNGHTAYGGGAGGSQSSGPSNTPGPGGGYGNSGSGPAAVLVSFTGGAAVIYGGGNGFLSGTQGVVSYPYGTPDINSTNTHGGNGGNGTVINFIGTSYKASAGGAGGAYTTTNDGSARAAFHGTNGANAGYGSGGQGQTGGRTSSGGSGGGPIQTGWYATNGTDGLIVINLS